MPCRTSEEIVEMARNSGMRLVLVITALPLEMEAVRGHLNPIGAALGRKGAVYETGAFREGGQEFLVVVCVTGAGTHPAERAALVAHDEFGGFDLQMVVGIGGSRKATAPIGSVVAADHVYWPYSGKAGERGWSNRPREIPAHTRLIEIARMVCRQNAWHRRTPARDEVEDAASGASAADPVPVAQVAPIASVEAVLDDPQSALETQLAAHCGDAHVVEMEGYGAAFAAYHSDIPNIVVRGVSDMTRAKSEEADARYQPLAARHAAAFAFELLSQWGRAHPRDEGGAQAGRNQLQAASVELLAWPKALPGGVEIKRPELVELTAAIERSAESTTVVLGKPGSGKSALLSTLALRFAERGWPVLAIKADTLDPDVSSESDLQEHLGLDSRPSVLLRRLAGDEPVLLVLDQLDALAGYLTLRTARLSILLSLVRRLAHTGNVHVVLSSRTFEFEHDTRLKAVGAQAIYLALPEWSRVLEVLEAHGVHAAGWPQDAQEVMRAPQALATYLTLERKEGSDPFNSYQSMLDRLWTERVLGYEGGHRRSRLAARIANRMAEEESLWLASARFEDDFEDVEALESAGVLTTLDGSLGFRHQTLFDYALARNFAREAGRLSGYVLERQSSLFVRPKLWAGLTYLRGVERNAYHRELEKIWRARDLRAHLRYLLTEFLGQQARPTDREELLMAEALRSVELRGRAYRALSGSPGWFERFETTFVLECMSASDESADEMVGVLAGAWAFASANVVRLLNARWGANVRHDARTWAVLQSAGHWSDDALTLACTIVARTDIGPYAVDHVVGAIGVEQPEVALRLVRARLERELAQAQTSSDSLAGKRRPEFESRDDEMIWTFKNDPRVPLKRLIEGRSQWDTLPTLAEHAPGLFLEVLWPWFERCFDALAGHSARRQRLLGYALALDADFRFEAEQDTGLMEPALLGALRTAAETLAQSAPDVWRDWVARIGSLDATPAQRLIAHSFTVAPARFASMAHAFLLADTRRFVLGSIHGVNATSVRLVEAASEHWSDDEVQRFEAEVKAYVLDSHGEETDVEDRRRGRNVARRIRLSLLRALPGHRLDARTRRQIEEERRVFEGAHLGSRTIGPQATKPIMNAAAMARAADEDIVNAFRRLPDETGWDHPERMLVGGNIQLAQEFADFSRVHPQRAVRILRRLERGTGTRGAAYALEAMADGAAPEAVLDLMRDVVGRGFDGEELRMSACRSIETLIRREASIGDDIVAVLERWVHAPGIRQEDAEEADIRDEEEDGTDSRESDDGGEDHAHRSLIWGHGGLSTSPGAASMPVEVLVAVRAARGEHDELDATLWTHLRCCRDPWAWDRVLRRVPVPVRGAHVGRQRFLERLFAEVDGLVESKAAAFVVLNAPRWNGEFADAQLDRWMHAGRTSARQAYGEIVARVALEEPSMGWASRRLDALVASTQQHCARAGAALSAAYLWQRPEVRPRAAELLTALIGGNGEGVWTAVSELFRLLDELTPDPATISLLEAMAARPAPAQGRNAVFVAERLATLLPHEGVLVGRVARGLIVDWEKDVGDARSQASLAAQALVDLAVTLHQLSPETRDIGTELFERLLEFDSWEARQTQEEIDNRFREKGRSRRRRLPRRRQRRR